MELKYVFNSKLGCWTIYHDQWCKKGQTSVVVRTLSGGDFNIEKELVAAICKGFNLLPLREREQALEKFLRDPYDGRIPFRGCN